MVLVSVVLNKLRIPAVRRMSPETGIYQTLKKIHTMLSALLIKNNFRLLSSYWFALMLPVKPVKNEIRHSITGVVYNIYSVKSFTILKRYLPPNNLCKSLKGSLRSSVYMIFIVKTKATRKTAAPIIEPIKPRI